MSSADVSYRAPDGARLYSSSEVARLLGVTASVVSNRHSRPNMRVPIPEPAYVGESGRGGYWTEKQVAELIRARLERAHELELTARARHVRASSALTRARAELARAELTAAKFGAMAPSGSGTDSRAEGRV